MLTTSTVCFLHYFEQLHRSYYFVFSFVDRRIVLRCFWEERGWEAVPRLSAVEDDSGNVLLDSTSFVSRNIVLPPVSRKIRGVDSVRRLLAAGDDSGCVLLR